MSGDESVVRKLASVNVAQLGSDVSVNLFVQRFKSLPELLDIILESCRLVVTQPKSSSIVKICY